MRNRNINSGPVALLISLYFPPEVGGGSTGAWNRALCLYKLGYSVFVICAFPSYPTGKVSDPKYSGKVFCFETIGPIKVFRLRLLPICHDGYMRRFIIFINFVLASVLYVLPILRTVRKVKIVYARSPVLFSSIVGLIYSKLVNSFFVYEAADLWPEELLVFKNPLQPIVMSFGRFFAKICFSIPDVILTISNFAAELIIREYKPKAHVYGVPVGVDGDRFTKLDKDESREYLTQNSILPSAIRNKFIVLYSGLLSSAQQVDVLVFAAERLKEEDDIVMLVVGDGPEREKLEQLKRELQLGNFYMMGLQSREVVPLIIAAADVCTILLSPQPIFDIALPTKFYEYLGCRKPLIGMCHGELANIINQSNIGHTIQHGNVQELASTIKLFRDSPELMKSFENSSSNALCSFSLKNVSSMLSRILEKEMRVYGH